MKVLYFKNMSGDSAYPICKIDIDLTSEQIEYIVKNNIGDDYDVVDDYICGSYYITDFFNLKAASNLINKNNKHD